MISAILPKGITAVENSGDVPEAILLPEEKAALGCVAERRRREFTMARSCARRALAALGLSTAPILPGPQRQPLWPAGIVGSITHCAGYCAAVVAHSAQFLTIGIDAEIHDRLPDGVLDLVTLDDERTSLRLLPGNGTQWDCVLFSAKESVYKAWFPIAGSWLEFKDVLISFEPESGRFFARVLTRAPIIQGRALTHFSGRFLIEEGRVLTAVSLRTEEHLNGW
jgi:4'-phosphopantetheinyl transferase EntD